MSETPVKNSDMIADNTPQPPGDSSASQPEPARTFEDLTLAEVLGQFLRAPRRTAQALWQTLGTLPEDRVKVALPVIEAPPPEPNRSAARWYFVRALTVLGPVGVALIGSVLLQPESVRRTLDFPLGGALLIVGALVAAFVLVRADIGFRLKRLPPIKPLAAARDENEGALSASPFERFLSLFGLRLTLLGVALVCSLGAWFFNSDNTYTFLGVLVWAGSVMAWVGVFATREMRPGIWLSQAVEWARATLHSVLKPRWSWTVAALIVIVLVGAYFRLGSLSAYPPDMTSDHVEKLLDTNKVLNGNRSVFFPNNGGRESTQMYFLALLHQLTGIPISFELGKLGSALEGLLMLLFAYWMGRAIIGEDDHTLGNLTGVIMAAMVATSYWHTMLSRLGLRIVTTTLVATVVVVFLARAMRHNRRADFLACGLALGASMYFYQAARMLPLLVVVGFVLALLLRARSWPITRAYVMNMLALVVVAAAVFVPLARYWNQFPASFWERTGGRFFGEDMVPVVDAQGNPVTDPGGNPVMRQATTDDRMKALGNNLPVFFDNLRKSLLMFNWRGDNAWITGDPDGTPQLDSFTGAMFIIGLFILLILSVRRLDPTHVLLPVGIVVMVLPSALSIAYVIEVPSATRASGALPLVYLIAALALAAILSVLCRRLPHRLAHYALFGAAGVGLALGGAQNYYSYFDNAMSDYRESTFPYRQAGTMLRGFAESSGAPGNAFMIAWDYWWDHRALGIEAGFVGWPNGILRDDVMLRILTQMRANFGTRYELRPDRQLMFFLYPMDASTIALLQREFPGGSLIPVKAFNAERDFLTYIAPPVGCAWMLAKLDRAAAACDDDDQSGSQSEVTLPNIPPGW